MYDKKMSLNKNEFLNNGAQAWTNYYVKNTITSLLGNLK